MNLWDTRNSPTGLRDAIQLAMNSPLFGATYAAKDPTVRVLVGDDQVHVLDALQLLLKNQGDRTPAVTDPGRVLPALESEQFDAVLMDMNYERDTTAGEEGPWYWSGCQTKAPYFRGLDDQEFWRYVRGMRRWSISWPARLVLAGALAAIIVLPILRKVNLPSTALHLGTTPIVVHSRARIDVAPVLPTPGVSAGSAFPLESSFTGSDPPFTHPPQNSLLILHRSLRV